MIAELSPFNVSSFFWCLVGIAELLEFWCRNWDLSHVESNSELRGSDEARSESIKVSKELTNSDSLLLAG